MQKIWRLIPLSDPSGALWNMASDEVLLESRPRQPILRFYTWQTEAVTVGYFQDMAQARSRLAVRDEVPVVRRMTGGGAVRHGQDLTLSIVMPIENPYVAKKALDSYRDFHAVMLEGLRTHFPKIDWTTSKKRLHPRSGAACFQEPVCFDLCLEGEKVLGSSQRRRNGYILHETSIVLPLQAAYLAEVIRNAFTQKFNIQFQPKPLSIDEVNRSQQLVQKKYFSPEFSSVLTMQN